MSFPLQIAGSKWDRIFLPGEQGILNRNPRARDLYRGLETIGGKSTPAPFKYAGSLWPSGGHVGAEGLKYILVSLESAHVQAMQLPPDPLLAVWQPACLYITVHIHHLWHGTHLLEDQLAILMTRNFGILSQGPISQ